MRKINDDKAVSLCTEDGSNAPSFEFDLWSLMEDEGGNEPAVIFQLPDECWPENYDGGGVFAFSLEGLLQEFLSRRMKDYCAEENRKVSRLLSRYADAIERRIIQIDDEAKHES